MGAQLAAALASLKRGRNASSTPSPLPAAPYSLSALFCLQPSLLIPAHLRALALQLPPPSVFPFFTLPIRGRFVCRGLPIGNFMTDRLYPSLVVLLFLSAELLHTFAAQRRYQLCAPLCACASPPNCICSQSLQPEGTHCCALIKYWVHWQYQTTMPRLC